MQVEIRGAEPSDAEHYQRIYSQSQVQANTLQLPSSSLEYWKEKLSACAKQGKLRFVALVDGIVAGELTIYTQQNARISHVVSFGIGVDPAFAGKGVGSALMKFCLTYAFNWLAVRKIELEVFHDNEVAIGLYKKFGFREEGLKKGAAFRNGRYEDVLLMAKDSPHI